VTVRALRWLVLAAAAIVAFACACQAVRVFSAALLVSFSSAGMTALAMHSVAVLLLLASIVVVPISLRAFDVLRRRLTSRRDDDNDAPSGASPE
jgi:hypothetical protein